MGPNIQERDRMPPATRRKRRWPWFVLLGIWLPWTTLGAASLYAARSPRLACLLYHRFADRDNYARLTDADERVYTISDVRFDEQLAALRRLGYRSVTLAEAIAFIDGRGAVPEKAVLLTIDDGCRNVLRLAEPVLRRHGFSATVFITTDPAAYVFKSSVPNSERLSDDEIRRLDPAVWSVGGHGHTHRPLRDMSDAALNEELRQSRDSLADLTGTPPIAMAVPGNWQGPNVRAAAGRVGYTHVFVSDAGFIHPQGDRHTLPRINVSGRWSLRGFEHAVSEAGVAQRRVGRMVKAVLSPVIGRTAAGAVSRRIRAWLPTRIGSFLLVQAVFALIAISRLKKKWSDFRLMPSASYTCQRPPAS